jgi:hypothetical protein
MIMLNGFKGSIFSTEISNKRKIFFKYQTSSIENEFSSTMMCSFMELNLSSREKQKLSRHFRNELSTYKAINLFELNKHAGELCKAINNSEKNNICLEAHDYGAYVCLAALYSGKLSPKKKIVFNLSNTPLALFPLEFMKKAPRANHKVSYLQNPDNWMTKFESIATHKKIRCDLKKAA